ncbi:hypothetical protein [Eggerthella guodeyinii]|uniref:Uncharacterized protein n=1 Tax=Eggerthella guodeyinii TaxID=2690837 RepID=A0A6N7RIP0_9ACTN|nr:hypothetical protein [Eggerthella guodeyinii]MRX81183.1 hypothetical protein [Eggerthella guodeyinii]
MTAVCTVLMLVDGVMSVQSIDCWYQRMAGKTPDTPIEEFYAKHFDNAYMEHRFQTMTMNPEDATRTDVRWARTSVNACVPDGRRRGRGVAGKGPGGVQWPKR